MKLTISKLQNKKGKEKISMVTAYDALFAKLFDDIVDVILVGDSLNMSFMGKQDTISATIDQMIYHTQAVCNGAKNAFIITDMPFGSYSNAAVALNNAIKIYQKTNADAIKIEGGSDKADIVKYLTQHSIAVVAHIGLLPQFVRSEGGYKIKGKNEIEAKQLIEDAKILEKAGAVLLIIEGVKEEVAKQITQAVSIPTIGIGAGSYTDGQVLVWSDMLGFFEEFKPKFVRHYLNGATLVKNAIKHYVDDVKKGLFPDENEKY
jgi:3-methyl-2-oxobutanoate hydroxymethyltransferase